jgi:hypothetical protein
MQFCISHPHRKHETDLGNPLLKKQTNIKQAQIEFKITPSKKRRNTEKIRRNRHLLLQLSIAATFSAITNPQRSSSEQSAKPALLRKRRKRANEERERRTGGGRAGGHRLS